jgi:phosphinothricin acetyltransferase
MISLRPATANDAAAIAAIYAPYVVASAVSFETEPPTAREMRARITAANDQYPWIVAVDAETDVILGYAYASTFHKRAAYRFSAETSVYVAGNFQGQGVGRMLYPALLATLREQEYTQALALIALPNDTSIKLHEAVGFRRSGVFREVGFKNNRWHDVGIWQRELAEPRIPPAEIKLFSSVGIVPR